MIRPTHNIFQRFLITFCLVFTVSLISCNFENRQSESQSNSASKITEDAQKTGEKDPWFKSTQHDFGEIKYGEEVGARFGFENRGDGHLIIDRVSTSCGCTVAEYTEKPVAPGETGFIEVIFDTRGKSGAQIQKARVYFKDMNKPVRLSVVAQVVKK